EGGVVALIEVADAGAAASPAAAPKADAAPAAPQTPAASVKTAETGERIEPVAVPEQPDKLAQREVSPAQVGQPAPTGAAPRPPPVEFNADKIGRAHV